MDKYTLEDSILGEGSYGRVQKCVNMYSGQINAVKIIDKLFFDSEEEIEKLNKKIEIMKKIDHPNIVKVIESFENKSSIFIVMELFSGVELFEYISNLE